MNTEIELRRIGDELQRAFAADLHRPVPKPQRLGPGSRWRLFATRRARWLSIAATAVIAVPGVALATGVFTSPRVVARSLPAGARIFGTAACTVVRPNVEYRCRLLKAPFPDPIAHLTPKQWTKLLARPPHLGTIKIVPRRFKAMNGRWQTGQFVLMTPRQNRIYDEYRRRVLASFGFTPKQIAGHERALKAGTAGTGPGQFKGTVEPTVGPNHAITGGCRATSPDGREWECYLGRAAVRERVIGALGGYVPHPGVG